MARRRRNSRALRDAVDDMKADGETQMPNMSIPVFTDSLRPNEPMQDSIRGECQECGRFTMVAFRAWFRAVRPTCTKCGNLLIPSMAAQREYPQLRTQFGVAEIEKPPKPRCTPKTHCYYCGKKVSVVRGDWKCPPCAKKFNDKLWMLMQEYVLAEDKQTVEFPKFGKYKRSGASGLLRAMMNDPIQEISDEDEQVIGYLCGTHKPDAGLVLWFEFEKLLERKHCGYVLSELGVKVLVVYRARNPISWMPKRR